MVKVMPVPLETGKATCAELVYLPLVDAAVAKPGGPEAQTMKAQLCRHCPVVEACGQWAMTHAEAGIWAGMAPKYRTMRGAPNTPPVIPDYLHQVRAVEGRPAQPWRRAGHEVKPRTTEHKRKQDSTPRRLAALGVSGATVKRWAYEQGLVATITGRVALVHIEAWAAAHPHAQAG